MEASLCLEAVQEAIGKRSSNAFAAGIGGLTKTIESGLNLHPSLQVSDC